MGFTTQFGNLLDVGGQVFGSMPASARSIYEEGVRFPPVKLYAAGVLNNEALVKVLARNSRAPEAAVADVMALCTATAMGEQRILELCDRVRPRHLPRGLRRAARPHARARCSELIVEKIPEAPQSFEDFVDDDGRGNGPFRIKLTRLARGRARGLRLRRDVRHRPRVRSTSTCTTA